MKRGSEENSNEKTSRSPNQISTVENSDGLHIPFDLTVEILSKLPVKSLARFQCVSKSWSSLITNSIMAWSLTKPRLLVISNDRMPKPSVFSLCTYPLNTDKTSVSAEQDSTCTLLRGLHIAKQYQYVRGLFCSLLYSTNFVIHNPTTRESVLLPKIKPEIQKRFMDGLFGYDPVENQYKVLCIVRSKQKFEQSCHVFTLGDPKKQWRNIDFGKNFCPTIFSRVCINGKIYFITIRLERIHYVREADPIRSVLWSFDVRLEKFHYVPIPKQSLNLTLVNYQGKLGCICYSNDSVEMWVMDDHTGKQEWSKNLFSISPSLIRSLEDYTCGIAGVTHYGEVVIMPKNLYRAQRLYAYFYDPKQNKTRRVELKGELKSQEGACVRKFDILCVPDHVNNFMSFS